jgi:hypothetical protein
VVLDGFHPTFHSWLVPIVGAGGLVGAGALAKGKDWGRWVGLAAVVLSPAVWALSVLNPLYAGSSTSPLAGPVGTGYVAASHKKAAAPVAFAAPTGRYAHILSYLEAHQGSARYLVATQSAEPAEPLLRGSDAPVLVMGGFTGNTPFPGANTLASLVTSGQVRYGLLISNRPQTDGSRWVSAHCKVIPPSAYNEIAGAATSLYDCAPTK